ncbi:MAG: flagellar basal body P-ring protein FlgI [Phycisphaerae bacterium]|jgi:flagellar basal body P-ring protein FlgI|nr:flagellar basal body P-ring protein FlgI [Phycisphaerae bacterium]
MLFYPYWKPCNDMRITPENSMKARTLNILMTVLAAAVCLLVAGCPKDPIIKGPRIGERTIIVPTHHVGTVSQFAQLVGGRMLPVRGYGVIGGLGKDGSSQIPPHLRNYLIQYLRRRNIGSRRAGTENLPPERILRDMDTAIVEISGSIPSCAPKGRLFDVQIRAIGSQVRSLEGGVLYEAELRLATANVTAPGRGSKVLATAAGPVFVNPFVDETKVVELVKLRQGRVIGGGKSTGQRSVSLQLLNPDFSRAAVIQRSINERFQRPGKPRVANAKSSGMVSITIPPEWQRDYLHFLELVMHMSLQTSGGKWEQRARQVVSAMTLPKANHDALSLVLEAMGRRAIPMISTHYTDADPYVSYYSARAGMRLGDLVAAPEVILKAAASPGSPLRNEAIKELGRHPRYIRSLSVLTKTLDNSDNMIRVMAYESLRKIGRSSAVMTIPLGDFHLDIVKSKGRGVVYATQSETPRVVLFGGDMVVTRPMYFSGLQGLVTVNSATGDKYVTMFRKVGSSGRISPAFKIDPSARALICALGREAKTGQGSMKVADLDDNGKPKRDSSGQIVYKMADVKGLGLNYGQVVTVLHRLCKQGSLASDDASAPTRFVLQKPKELEDFLRRALDTGRPNITPN